MQEFLGIRIISKMNEDLKLQGSNLGVDNLDAVSKIELINDSCATQNTDVIVNAANKMLLQGSGICGEIFKRAGAKNLTRACNEHHLYSYSLRQTV